MTTSGGPLARAKAVLRRLAADGGVAEELATLRADLEALAAAGDRIGDRIEALSSRLDELAADVAELRRAAGHGR